MFLPGECCVHIAAMRSEPAILRQLITAFGTKLDLNAREGRSGYTALHLACERRDVGLIDLLLSAECRPLLQLETCTYGRVTAYQLAAALRDDRTMESLERCGAEPLEPESSDEDSDTTSDEEDDSSDDEKESGATVSNELVGVALAV